MDLTESEDTKALRELLRRFLEKEVPPEIAARWDREDRIPREMLRRLAALGVCGLTVPEEHGGMGRDVFGMVTTIQELGRRSVALAGLYIINACYGSLNIAEAGTEEQKQRLLPGLCAGEILVAYGRVPALALGIAEAAVAEAWEYSQQRKQFGSRICGIQSIRHMLADAQTKLAACRSLLVQATWKVHTGMPSTVDTSMAKLFVWDTARDIVLSCQQVLGAYGYAHGFAMERHVRDVLVMSIFGGSSAIQKNNIANLLRLPRE